MPAAREQERGMAIVTVLMLMALVMAMIVGYYLLTHMESMTTQATMNSVKGFYAAEAGLNMRAQQIRQTFLGYNRPGGTSPMEGSGYHPCDPGNTGSADFGCVIYSLHKRDVMTYVVEDPGNPVSIVVPRGEPFQNLSAQVYGYRVPSVSIGPKNRPEAKLEMTFDSRLIPLFQFAAFYNKDLEILPGPPMRLRGPVHSNGDLYLDSGNSLDIEGQVTTAGHLFLGRKNQNNCVTGDVAVPAPSVLTDLPACSGGARTELVHSDVAAWAGMVELGIDPLTVPPPEALDAAPGQIYWDKADLRVVLDLDSGTPVIEVRNPDGSVDSARSTDLNGCSDAAEYNDEMYNNREGTYVDMLDVDMEELIDCVQTEGLLMLGRALDDGTEGGLVLYLGVEGPNMNGVNNYGVRVSNGDHLASTVGGSPTIQGLTVVTNQAVYIQGDYNSTSKKPASFLADSLNILSNDWDDDDSDEDLDEREATDTTIYAAFLAGTDSSGGVEGIAGQDLGNYNGGLENYPRFHEDWSGETLTYRGSLVSLNTPRHVDGAWAYGNPYYTAPNRDWDYDTDFNDAANLPPISPRFVYLRQELFVRDFGD